MLNSFLIDVQIAYLLMFSFYFQLDGNEWLEWDKPIALVQLQWDMNFSDPNQHLVGITP